MCVFCKIVNNEIPCYKVYENDKVLAFLDIKPVHPGHVLVIPKKHYSNIEEIPDDELAIVIKAVKIIGQQLKDKLNVLAYNVLVNNGSIAGQEVLHLHFHVIPRYKDDNLSLFAQQDYLDGQAEEILKKILIK